MIRFVEPVSAPAVPGGQPIETAPPDIPFAWVSAAALLLKDAREYVACAPTCPGKGRDADLCECGAIAYLDRAEALVAALKGGTEALTDQAATYRHQIGDLLRLTGQTDTTSTIPASPLSRFATPDHVVAEMWKHTPKPADAPDAAPLWLYEAMDKALSILGVAALCNHVATVHNTSANVPQTEALTCPTKLLMRIGMLAGLIRHIRPGHPMTRDITDGLVSDANHILRELAVMGIEHPGVSDSEAQAMRSAARANSQP